MPSLLNFIRVRLEENSDLEGIFNVLDRSDCRKQGMFIISSAIQYTGLLIDDSVFSQYCVYPFLTIKRYIYEDFESD